MTVAVWNVQLTSGSWQVELRDLLRQDCVEKHVTLQYVNM